MINIGDNFRYAYADGNCLWTVLEKKAKDVYLCEIVNEPIEYNGKTLDSDYAGVQKAFLKSEIEIAIKHDALIKGMMNDHEDFYKKLRVGSIVHYHNGFQSFVRCKVNENKELVPFALVGNWRDYELPRLGIDGEIVIPYYCKKIEGKESFKPNASNIYEYSNFSRKNIDPTSLPEIDIKPPENKKNNFWFTVDKIKKEIAGKNPELILSNIKKILEEVKND